MRIFIIGLICIISPLLSFGHNPLSAKYHIEAGEHASLLSVSLSQDGVNHVFSKKYGKERFSEMNRKEFEELLVDYIKKNFNLSIDGKEIKLSQGGIKLGSHQTDLKFVLPPLPQKIGKIEVDIPAFKENKNHQTIFSYKTKGVTNHVILSSSNDYQSTINLQAADTNAWLWLILIGGIILVIMIFLKFRFHSKKLNYYF